MEYVETNFFDLGFRPIDGDGERAELLGVEVLNY